MIGVCMFENVDIVIKVEDIDYVFGIVDVFVMVMIFCIFLIGVNV